MPVRKEMLQTDTTANSAGAPRFKAVQTQLEMLENLAMLVPDGEL